MPLNETPLDVVKSPLVDTLTTAAATTELGGQID
jgi:hypothetical protein